MIMIIRKGSSITISAKNWNFLTPSPSYFIVGFLLGKIGVFYSKKSGFTRQNQDAIVYGGPKVNR